MLPTRQSEQLLVAGCLAAKQPVANDNTNPLPSDRARYIDKAPEAGFRVVAYFVQSSPDDANRRNNQRSGGQKFPNPAIEGSLEEARGSIARWIAEYNYDQPHRGGHDRTRARPRLSRVH